MKLLIILLIFFSFAKALDTKFQFLTEFFLKRNVMLTIFTCENDGIIKSFLIDKNHLDNFIGIKVHGNSSDPTKNVFNNFSPRNWNIIDIHSCGQYIEFISYMDKVDVFRYPLKHIFLVVAQDYDDIKNYLCTCRILAGSEVLLAPFKRENVEIFEIYKIGMTSTCMSVQYANWSKENGMAYFHPNMPKTQRRRNFQNYEIVINVVVNNNNSLLVNFDDVRDVTEDEPYFFEDFPNVLKLVEFYNASYSIRLNKQYGHFNHTTGKYYGLIKDMAYGTGDITGISLVVSEDRSRTVTYITKSTTLGTSFILQKPSMSYVKNIYFMTFTGPVWLASLISLLIFSFALYPLLNWEMSQEDSKKMKYTFSDATLLSFEALCQQGTLVVSGLYSGRCLLFIFFTAFMFLYAAYSGYVLVLLQSTVPIASIRQLVDSRFECGGVNISFIIDWYHVNRDPALRELYKKKLTGNIHTSLENGLKKVQRGNFAFHTPTGIAYNNILKTFKNYDICKLQELPGYMSFAQYYGVPKSSQYKIFFKVGLLRVTEAGLSIRNQQRLARKPKCYNQAGNFQSVGIYDCYIIFEIFFIGCCLALIIFTIEILTNKYLRHLKIDSISCVN